MTLARTILGVMISGTSYKDDDNASLVQVHYDVELYIDCIDCIDDHPQQPSRR